jgi:hypothetical protein
MLVTRGAPTFLPGCGPAEVAGVLVDFFDALNENDAERLVLRSALGVEPAPVTPLAWFAVLDGDSADGTRNVVADTQAELLAYAAERVQQHERLQLLATDADPSAYDDSVNIVFYLSRRADDLLDGPEHMTTGKGAVECSSQRIRVLTISTWPRGGEQELDRHLRALCPAPPAGSPQHAIIVCARE